MRRLRVAGPVLALVLSGLLASTAQSGAVKKQPNRVKETAKPVWTLALDGPRVAYASDNRIYGWNVVTGATSVVKGDYSHAAHRVNPAVIALAGKRVAWIRYQQIGNTQLITRLYTAQLGGPAHRLRMVPGYTNTGCGGGGGSQISGLVGSGSVLAVSTWKASVDGTSASNRRLNLITPAGLRPIASGPDTIVSASADDGHIAVVPLPTLTDPDKCLWTPRNSVEIYGTDGKLLRQIEVDLGWGDVALSGNRLVVPSGTATRELDVYNWMTGALVHAWPTAEHVSHFAVTGRLAVYPGRGEKLRLLDLTTGKDVVIASATKGLNRNFALGRRGLVYVVNHWNRSPLDGPLHGKLVFVPMANLLARLQ